MAGAVNALPVGMWKRAWWSGHSTWSPSTKPSVKQAYSWVQTLSMAWKSSPTRHSAILIADLDRGRHVVLDVAGLGGEVPAVGRRGAHLGLSRVGPYVIGEFLDQGAQGDVYTCRRADRSNAGERTLQSKAIMAW